ncbi:bax inhibitor 1-like [Raphanus sativus]|uniref:Bax inhibitor 1-like n=1 Tax=Raphanus sativus TaxID=3726 RepID=A0A6J0N3I8_RAPSA|nr:bax inhibitor 1-like [Raphanus sativus]
MQEAFSSNDYLRELSPPMQFLLKRVYVTLLCALLAFAFGSYLHMLWNVGGIVTSLGFFGGVHLLRFTTPNEQSSKRLSLLFLSALLKGASIGPMIELAIEVDASFVVTACVATAVPFACFATASMLTRRREYLYLGGVLSSLVSILWWLQFSSSITHGSASVFIFNLELYFALFIFVGCIVVDTHMIIEKSHGGDMDYVGHSLTFFTKLIEVLVFSFFIVSSSFLESFVDFT